MPFAQIYLMEGRSEEQKRAVIEKVSQALVEALDAPLENVRGSTNLLRSSWVYLVCLPGRR